MRRENASVRNDPRTPQEPSGLGTNSPHVGLRVIDVADLEGPVPMAGRALRQLPIEGLLLIGSPAALPLECLFSASAPMDRDGEGLITRSEDLPAVAI